MSWFSVPKKISDLKVALSRDEMLRVSRILIIDDERPDLIDDLKKARFFVDHLEDITPENIHELERTEYDVVILDFGNVGSKMGPDQGLTLMKHIKRIRPSVVVLAYTSKALETQHAEFFRLADGVLPKDAGIVDSTERIEEALKKAHSVENLWRGMLASAGIEPGSKQDNDWQDLFVRGLSSNRKMAKFKGFFESDIGKDISKQAALAIIGKLITLVGGSGA